MKIKKSKVLSSCIMLGLIVVVLMSNVAMVNASTTNTGEREGTVKRHNKTIKHLVYDEAFATHTSSYNFDEEIPEEAKLKGRNFKVKATLFAENGFVGLETFENFNDTSGNREELVEIKDLTDQLDVATLTNALSLTVDYVRTRLEFDKEVSAEVASSPEHIKMLVITQFKKVFEEVQANGGTLSFDEYYQKKQKLTEENYIETIRRNIKRESAMLKYLGKIDEAQYNYFQQAAEASTTREEITKLAEEIEVIKKAVKEEADRSVDEFLNSDNVPESVKEYMKEVNDKFNSSKTADEFREKLNQMNRN
ncbi:MAG: hypothetical protein MJA82_18055 [Clostridia bacterium]|nr:hypothetical protein [Clostridia bacterium]